ncbi:MAG TPA: DUF192 domain-containing protein [Candidatus Nanoarchaeia archaeon]|nr:DUF192 domain-containing protein [Candidatus Nanoarchaeia archaeon]
MIRNETKNKLLVNHSSIADTFFKKCLGFMFASRKDQGVVFYFNMEKNTSFHTFFMRFSLDFLFLDSQKRVVKILKNVRPWKLSVSGHGKYVVELPSGRSLNTSVGDKISFK